MLPEHLNYQQTVQTSGGKKKKFSSGESSSLKAASPLKVTENSLKVSPKCNTRTTTKTTTGFVHLLLHSGVRGFRNQGFQTNFVLLVSTPKRPYMNFKSLQMSLQLYNAEAVPHT